MAYITNDIILDDPRLANIFLNTLAETGQVKKACEAVDISTPTAYRYRQRNSSFAAQWQEAMNSAVEAIESEVIRRSIFGHDEPVVYQGQFVPEIDYDAIDPETNEKYPPALAPVKRDAKGRVVYATTKKYSDALAAVVLKANSPKYRDQSRLELTGANGGPVEVNSQMNATAAAARIAALLAVAKKRSEGQPEEPDISDLV
jgi:hypothetical protein